MSDLDQNGTYLNRRPLMAGVALVSLGGMVAAIGALLSGLAAVSGARRWVDHLEQPPRDMARLKLHQARAASLAGVDAWRKTAVS